ncbi:MAG: type II toxin-antitoxin system HicB family antitoxin [Phycisphaerae bacterium]|nr:type II toxin-antitoxin system HicB family antitoxin [Phycisphaerae bacterium]
MTYRITINGWAGRGYRADCPQLPGCRVFADSPEAARRKIHDAVAGYVASLDVALPRELKRLYIREADEQLG